MKVLHLMASGNAGGIEVLMRDFSIQSRNDNVFVFVWTLGTYAEQIKANGSKVLFLDGKGKSTVRILKELVSLSKIEKPDVVISHHASPVFKLMLMAVKFLGLPIKTLAYSHSSPADPYSDTSKIKEFIYRGIHKAGFRSADGVIVISDLVKRKMISCMKIQESRVHMIYNGVNLKRFASAPHAFDGVCHLIYVGRLIPQKGVQVTLNALSMLPKEYKWDFKIVGDGEYREELEKLTCKLGISNKVAFLGTRSDVPDLLKGADIFPHLCVWQEGFGIGVAEAMAAGKLCVGADTGAMGEIIDHEENGYLVPSGDAEAAAELLGRLMRNPDKWRPLQMKAQRKSENFDIVKFTAQLDALIESV